jgi:hypothetical protein
MLSIQRGTIDGGQKLGVGSKHTHSTIRNSIELLRRSLHQRKDRVNRMPLLHHIDQTCFGPLNRFPRKGDWSTLLVSCVVIFLQGNYLTFLPKRLFRILSKFNMWWATAMIFCHVDCCLFEKQNVVGINGATLVQSALFVGMLMIVIDVNITLVASIGDQNVSYDTWQYHLLVGSRQSKKEQDTRLNLWTNWVDPSKTQAF